MKKKNKATRHAATKKRKEGIIYGPCTTNPAAVHSFIITIVVARSGVDDFIIIIIIIIPANQRRHRQ